MKKFGLETTKHMRTPMGTNVKLTKDKNSSSVDPTLYKTRIGNLLYLSAIRPNICYSVGVCTRYRANPKEFHLATVKRIIRFVNGIVNFDIWYSKDTNMNLVGFCDEDEVKNVDDRKSTSGGCFYLGNNMIS